MKKNLLLFMCIIFLLLLTTGCGNSAPVNQESTPAKNQDSTPVNNQESTPTDNSDNAQEDNQDSTKETDVNEENNTKNNTVNSADSIKLKTFEEIYESDGLKHAVYYLNDNYDTFDDKARDEYKLSLAQEISNRANQYYPLISMEPVEGPAPLTIENVNWLYKGRYSSDTNSLFVNGLGDEAKEAALSIMDDDFFTLCKKYYAMDGVIEDMGFDIIVDKDIHDILMDRYSDYSEEPNYYFEFVKSYTDILGISDTKLQSEETYPFVLVEDPSQIEVMRNEWKVEILLPVNFEEGMPSDEESVNYGTFKIEEIKEIPLEDSIESYEATNPLYDDEPEENLTTYIFVINGKFEKISLTTSPMMGSEKESYDLYEDGENIVLKYNTMFPTDFSNDTLIIKSASGNEYKMQLNDAVDRDLYLFAE